MAEDLSRSEFQRLTRAKKKEYIDQLLGKEDESSGLEEDSDDENCLPSDALTGGSGTDTTTASEASEGEGESSSSSEESATEGAAAGDQAAGMENACEYITKDKTVWSKIVPTVRQTPSYNKLRQKSGPHASTVTLSMSDTFKKIMTAEMIDMIVRYTNQKAKKVYEKCNEKDPSSIRSWRPVTAPEMYAFFGILICSGANNSNTDHISDMWKRTSYPIYRAALGYNRFRLIMQFIRFDDANTRQARAEKDKAAPIRDLWTMLNDNLRKMYKPTENMTIDEQLYPYRGHTKFTQYIPSKPAKYGIKIWWICDAENAYPLFGILYTGKIGNVREKNQGERVVKELAEPYRGSGRNITMDNYFTTLPLAKALLSEGLTITGTLKKNKPYIPTEFKANKSRPEYSSLFAFHENKITLCSYVPKKNKAVILLSSMHNDDAVNDDEKKKPHIICDYNKHKTGVDTMDQMVGRYTTHRRTRRWPLAMFFNMLDVAALAGYIIYYENNSMIKKKTHQRRIFLRQLSEELTRPVIENRFTNDQVMRNHSTKVAIEAVLGPQRAPLDTPAKDDEPRDSSGRKKVVGSCHVCYRLVIKRRRKTRKSCIKCEQPVCDEHSVTSVTCTACNE